ncbi:helix-turn-helix domain-containing protein [Nitratiruptor sp. SB155-2]|uniref:helix-turn-helix domain-containing protein n=1 Tax=Nitratiruptor sp. (strain SB155-2) TaxID=387092 RepID=UPI000326D4F2|nr:helix-turn-helix transcriptional regulator [Nitratiruptor sp. SB155-2]
MDNKEFKQLLKKAGLTNKELADLLNISPQSVNNWSVKGYPYWLKSWLQNYIKAKTLDNVKDVICNEDDPNSTAS